MICPICGKRSNKKEVCTNCGLVVDMHPIQSNPRMWNDRKTRDRKYDNTFQHPLSPDIGYGHVHSRNTSCKDLRGAFNRQRKGFNNKEHRAYIHAYQYIKLLGGNLKLPKKVTLEAINLYRALLDKKPDFPIKYGLKVFYLVFIKIACKIHDYPISNGELKTFIDYPHKETNNIAYMDRIFNTAYQFTISVLKLKFIRPESPNYIIYVCSKLKLPQSCSIEIYKMYEKIKKYIKFRLEGYIIALYYIRFKKKHGLTYRILEKEFEKSRLTISSKIKEIKEILGRIKYDE